MNISLIELSPVDLNTVQVGNQSSYGFYGILVLSVLGEYATGGLTGPAFGASYILVKTEVDNGKDVHNMNGNPIPAGVYIYKIAVSKWESTEKLTVLN